MVRRRFLLAVLQFHLFPLSMMLSRERDMKLLFICVVSCLPPCWMVVAGSGKLPRARPSGTGPGRLWLSLSVLHHGGVMKHTRNCMCEGVRPHTVRRATSFFTLTPLPLLLLEHKQTHTHKKKKSTFSFNVTESRTVPPSLLSSQLHFYDPLTLKLHPPFAYLPLHRHEG